MKLCMDFYDIHRQLTQGLLPVFKLYIYLMILSYIFFFIFPADSETTLIFSSAVASPGLSLVPETLYTFKLQNSSFRSDGRVVQPDQNFIDLQFCGESPVCHD